MDHFEDMLDMIELAKGAVREVDNIKLSRYACYLIVQNADPSKDIVALGQTYFVLQTLLQEIKNSYEKITSKNTDFLLFKLWCFCRRNSTSDCKESSNTIFNWLFKPSFYWLQGL